MLSDVVISQLPAEDLDRRIPDLAALLHACVHAGASVNFVLPFPLEEAEAFWRSKVLPAAREGTRLVLIAEAGGRILGTAQLSTDTPPNQPHRADVSKVLVHPEHRRRGIARALMAAIDAYSVEMGRRLLTLDTRTGDAAEPLYRSLGFQVVGTIPGYSRAPQGDALEATTIMYKHL
ncbi:GNAT family N-acetyltransferase [Aurantimonas sp. VKM B-3413]|uniref:GNAT family N-acetyltransferase n=1 Tax=Aurantimonas sp. VKM B-3413 TaxID=2779401 RepID=UPI001E37B424|nr:GNAT family N-acetyltransferase [Aurantimonas sp. VKM B-3413]MCB8838821.1 GNAT family N-acetyltransferase [Aurantimonas sp. VKM B-3413]